MESYEIKDDEILLHVSNILGITVPSAKLVLNIDNKKLLYTSSTNSYEELDESNHLAIRSTHYISLLKYIKIYARVNDVNRSSNYFGLKTLKSKTLNNVYEVSNFILGYVPGKFPNDNINVAELSVNNRNIKYDLRDLDFYIVVKKPTNIKKPKVNKDFTVNCKLRVVNPKHTKLKKNEIVDLIKIKSDPKSKRLFHGSKTRALDIVTVKRGDSSLVNSYAKNFKKIIN